MLGGNLRFVVFLLKKQVHAGGTFSLFGCSKVDQLTNFLELIETRSNDTHHLCTSEVNMVLDSKRKRQPESI